MGQKTLETEYQKRSIIARVGICLLNFLQPGLGLVRLAQYRVGFSCMAGGYILSAVAIVAYALEIPSTFSGFISVVAVLLLALFLLYAAAIGLSWKWSNLIGFRKGWLWHWYGLLGVSALSLIVSYPIPDFARHFYRTFYLPSISMAPALDVGDRFLAQMQIQKPLERGDVVIVQLGDIEYVKRIAAVPGDTIAMRDGIVILNGEAVAQQMVGTVTRNSQFGSETVRRLRDQFPNEGRTHSVYDSRETSQDQVPEVRLGKRQYFLLGDNRDQTADSRFQQIQGGLGIVTRDQITGRALFRFWRSGIGISIGQL